MFYKHIKSGRVYTFIAVAIDGTNATDGRQMVIYYGPTRDGTLCGLFVREYTEFHEKFKVINDQ